MPEKRDGAGVRLSADTWEALFRAQSGMMRRLQAAPVFGDLSIREYDVLFTLSGCPSGAARLNEINEHVLLSQPSLSRLIDRLEKRGLVRRRRDPADGRGVVVELTDDGRATQREMGREHVRDIDALLGPALTDEEKRQLKALAGKLLANLPTRASRPDAQGA